MILEVHLRNLSRSPLQKNKEWHSGKGNIMCKGRIFMISCTLPRQKRLLVISTERKKKGLFDISKEFHSGVCNHNKSGASPRRQGKSLIEGKRKLRVADILNRVLAVHWSSCSQKSSLSSSCWTLVSSQGMRAPSSGFPILFN